jgi:perosamine synthetase
MLVTDNKDLFDRAKKDQDHGRRPGTFWIEQVGHKYKMNNITAALGLAQLQRVDNQIFRKREINQRYMRGLSHLPFLKFQPEIKNSESICWMSSFRLTEDSAIGRDVLISELSKRNIDSRPVFPAISQYQIWGYAAATPPNSKIIGDSAINLPSGVRLSDNAVDRVIANIDQILNL